MHAVETGSVTANGTLDVLILSSDLPTRKIAILVRQINNELRQCVARYGTRMFNLTNNTAHKDYQNGIRVTATG